MMFSWRLRIRIFRAVCLYAIYLIESRGLLLSPKSVAILTDSITWLGKEICNDCIVNTPARVAHALLALWTLRCFRLSFCGLQRLLGYLQLLLSSTMYSPFLASAYALLRQPHIPRLLPRNSWQSLLVACLGQPFQ